MANPSVKFYHIQGTMPTSGLNEGAIYFVKNASNDYGKIYIATGSSSYEEYSKYVKSASFSDDSSTSKGGTLTLTFNDTSTITATGIASVADLEALETAASVTYTDSAIYQGGKSEANKVTTASAIVSDGGGIKDVKVADTSLTVTNNSVSIPVASTGQSGTVKVDGTSITITDGVISAPTSGVTKIVKGDGISVSPATGIGEVTVSAKVSKSNGLDVDSTNGITLSASSAGSTAAASTAGAMTGAQAYKLENIEAGAQVNVIESVKLNGTALSVSDKSVNVTAIQDVQVDGKTVVSSNSASLSTINGDYDASTNKLATKNDIASITGAMHYLGISNTEITDGGTEKPTIDGKEVTTLTKGDVVIYGIKEFVWSGSESPKWQQLGDETATVTSINGQTGALTFANTDKLVTLSGSGSTISADLTDATKTKINGAIQSVDEGSGELLVAATTSSNAVTITSTTKLQNAVANAEKAVTKIVQSGSTITVTGGDTGTTTSITAVQGATVTNTVGTASTEDLTISNGKVAISTMSAYNATTNPIATKSDIEAASLLWAEWGDSNA